MISIHLPHFSQKLGSPGRWVGGGREGEEIRRHLLWFQANRLVMVSKGSKKLPLNPPAFATWRDQTKSLPEKEA